jgi:hypothetical protein
VSRIPVFVVALILWPLALDAQRQNTREGFWIGFGLGSGSVGVDCPTCADDRVTNVSGYLRLGGTVSRKVLLGFESTGWTNSEVAFDESLGFGSFIMSWYPSATGAFYLKVGVGGLSYVAEDDTDELTATAPAGSFGVGYEIRIGRNLSLAPVFNILASGAAKFKFNGVTAPSGQDISINMVQLGLGLHWH